MAPEFSVSPIQPHSSLRERVEVVLAAAIRSGEMPAGRLYSAPTLAARFDVSATPVREAMLNLEKQGFVEAVRNKGFRVTTVREADVREIVEVRQLLEPPVVGRLAGHIPATAYPRLDALAEQIVLTAAAGDLAGYLEADAEFHTALVAFAGNARLGSLIAELRAQTRMPGLAELVATDELAESADEHRRLLRLLEAGRGADAAELMHRHIAHVIGWWAGRAEPDVAPVPAAGVPA